MSDRDAYGPDTLLVPAYLSTGPDDPGLEAWKREHPDWFEAGTWTRPADPATERRRRRLEATRTVGLGRDRPPLDPATLSVADFHRTAAQARSTAAAPPLAQTVAPRSGSPASQDDSPFLHGGEPLRANPIAYSDPNGGQPLILNDGTPALDRTGRPILVPPGVDLNRTSMAHGFLQHSQ